MTQVHLHRDDCPKALAILHAVLRHRHSGGDALGFEPTENGAWVNWSRLTTSSLSTTETAVVHLAQGVAILERHGGGLPGHLQGTVFAALGAIDPSTRRTSRQRLVELQDGSRLARRHEEPGDEPHCGTNQ